jgi:hypothetical protein
LYTQGLGRLDTSRLSDMGFNIVLNISMHAGQMYS